MFFKIRKLTISFESFIFGPVMDLKHLLMHILLPAILLPAGTLPAAAQQPRQLSVKKISVTAPVAADSVPALLDGAGVAFQPLDVANWQDLYPYRPAAEFRVAHTGRELLLHFRVTEEAVRAVAGRDNGPVWQDACVEFFVDPDGDGCYYNFECNCIGHLLVQGGRAGEERPLARADVLARVRRWSSLGTEPFGLRVGPCTWQLTMVIPVEALYLHRLASLEGRTMRANFYKCGDRLPRPHYLSWSPIGLERPQFHCPQFFGTLHLLR